MTVVSGVPCFRVTQLISGEWEVVEEVSRRQVGVYWTQDQVIIVAEHRARNAQATPVVHDRYGEIQETRDYRERRAVKEHRRRQRRIESLRHRDEGGIGTR